MTLNGARIPRYFERETLSLKFSIVLGVKYLKKFSCTEVFATSPYAEIFKSIAKLAQNIREKKKT